MNSANDYMVAAGDILAAAAAQMSALVLEDVIDPKTNAPLVAFGPEVVFVQVFPDGFSQLRDAAKTSRQDDLLAQIAKESLHQIQPGSRGGGEVQLEVGPFL